MNILSRAVLLLSLPAASIARYRASDFEGYWKGFDNDDGSELTLSITRVDGTTYEIFYKDSQWSPSTCSGFGTATNDDYVLDANAGTLKAPKFGPVYCNNGEGGQDETDVSFDDPDWVLQDDGSLLWYGLYRFTRVSESPYRGAFAGYWKAIDNDDGSDLEISVSCGDDQCEMFYRDSQWAATTCDSFGIAINTYNVKDSSKLFTEIFGPVSCNDGAGSLTETEVTFDDPEWVMQDNGSLVWYETYRFWLVGRASKGGSEGAATSGKSSKGSKKNKKNVFL